MRRFALVITLLLLPLCDCPASAQDEIPKVARDARGILQEHCYSCHGEGGAAEGGFNFALDAAQLVRRELVVPGDPRKSVLIQRIQSGPGRMPKGTDPLSDSDIKTLVEWVKSGADSFSSARPKRRPISLAGFRFAIAEHQESLRKRERAFARYFSITHLYNAGIPEDQLETYRLGLARLINSLSRGGDIRIPEPIPNSEETILYIDLRWFDWTNETWDRILSANPYGFASKGDRIAYADADSALPVVRADWFVAAASLSPLYYDILLVQETGTGERTPVRDIADLQSFLRLSMKRRLQTDQVIRAGFANSGISRNNRIIERYRTNFGYLWNSYDSDSSTGAKDFKKLPLGPASVFGEKRSFDFDGGEMIFTLPNGLQGYALFDAAGGRLNEAPTSVVQDSDKRAQSVVVRNARSCFRCHNAGILPKRDEIRPHWAQLEGSVEQDELETVLTLYPEQDVLAEAYLEDTKRFQSALREVSERLPETDPINVLANRFEEPVDLSLAAAEAFVSAEFLREEIKDNTKLEPVFGPLLVAPGVMKRDTFGESFPLLVSELGQGEPISLLVQFPNYNGVRTTSSPAPSAQLESNDRPQIAAIEKMTMLSELDAEDYPEGPIEGQEGLIVKLASNGKDKFVTGSRKNGAFSFGKAWPKESSPFQPGTALEMVLHNWNRQTRQYSALFGEPKSTYFRASLVGGPSFDYGFYNSQRISFGADSPLSHSHSIDRTNWNDKGDNVLVFLISKDAVHCFLNDRLLESASTSDDASFTGYHFFGLTEGVGVSRLRIWQVQQTIRSR